jgi:hypothetical protein
MVFGPLSGFLPRSVKIFRVFHNLQAQILLMSGELTAGGGLYQLVNSRLFPQLQGKNGPAAASAGLQPDLQSLQLQEAALGENFFSYSKMLT